MKCMGAIHDTRAAGRATCEFDRSFDTFCPRIRKKDLVEIRYVLQQTLSQHARQGRNVELHEVGQVAIEDALQCLAQGRMISANRKNAKTAQ